MRMFIYFLAFWLGAYGCVNSPTAVTLGGKITGLRGSIVFEDLGVGKITASNDGDFTFKGSRLQGQNYNVIITQQPAGQSCSVQRGSGIFGGENVKDVVVSCDRSLLLASWNIENYGPSKASKASVMSQITQVMLHFDIIFIQEMPTSSTSVTCVGYANQSPANCLLTRLNATDRAGANGYSSVVTVSGDEAYGFFYRNSKVSLIGSSFLSNSVLPGLTFTRPPIIARFRAGSFDFYVVSVHTTPDNVLTRSEIYNLPSIANYLAPTDADIIILGDFNSGSTYFTTPGDWNTYFANFTTSGYTNLIADGIDTTITTSTAFTYDRMTLSPSIAGKVQPNSAAAYNFDGLGGSNATCTSGDTAATMNAIILEGCAGGILFGHVSNPCTCNGAALEVSDHYPVGLQLNY